jgi:hypothetical protein
MSMKQQCQDAIYNYVDADTQRNAALTGEHKEYVCLVLQLMRDEYHIQLSAGATEFTVPAQIHTTLTELSPW